MISVIVPIYNVEDYLEKCITSIINQTYSDLEIILVNDGSTDKSIDICRKFEYDKRIKLIQKDNGGLSDARNKGLEYATGEYIAFVDSDDYIHPQMFEIMYMLIQQEKADIVTCNFQKVSEREEISYQQLENQSLPFEVLDKVQALCEIDKVYVIAWNKLYRRKIFENIRFLKGKLHEDEYLIHHILNRCNRIVVLDTVLYYYVQRENSIMGMINIRRICDKREALIGRMEFVLNNSITEAIEPTVNRLLDYQIEIYDVIKSGSLKEKNEINKIKKLQKVDYEYIRKIIKSNHISLEKKYTLFFIHPALYEINRIGLKSFLAISIKRLFGMQI